MSRKLLDPSVPITTRDLTGLTFGKLFVVERAPDRHIPTNTGSRQRNAYWLVQCECGTRYELLGHALTSKVKGRKACQRCKNAERRLNGELSRNHYRRIIDLAEERSIPVSDDMTYEFLMALYESQGRRCALSGIPIVFAETAKLERKGGQSTASLDRIDNAKGYLVDNVQWVHKDVNRMKSNFSQERFLEIAAFVSKVKEPIAAPAELIGADLLRQRANDRLYALAQKAAEDKQRLQMFCHSAMNNFFEVML